MSNIDITDFFNGAAPMDYSASRAEIGQNAGADTWRAACDDSADWNMINTPELRDEFRSYVKGFGAWTMEEIAAWSDQELNALFIQLVSGDIRESDMTSGSDAHDWRKYRLRAENGEVSGHLWHGSDHVEPNDRIYYTIGD